MLSFYKLYRVLNIKRNWSFNQKKRAMLILSWL